MIIILAFIIYIRVPAVVIPKEEIIELPTLIQIPVINFMAGIEEVGLKSDGSMDLPVLSIDTGWYNLGPRPGEIGSAVINGHLNTENGDLGVFANLNKLKSGDKVSVQDDKGLMINFVVREIKIYKYNADASDIFISNDGKSHLNLITCTGYWNSRKKTYSSRLVVFTDREE